MYQNPFIYGSFSHFAVPRYPPENRINRALLWYLLW
jgi:hypothetical protein